MKHYYYGKFPEGWEKWNGKATENDYLIGENGWIAFRFRGRFRMRSPSGSWETLGYSPIWGSGYSHWTELQSTNREWFSDNALEAAFSRMVPPVVLEWAIVPMAEKTRQVMAEGRLQQSQWAKAVKNMYGNKCAVTGSTVGLEACHIKPFAECTPAEAVDLNNGVCLTASVHALFDSGAQLPADDPLAKIIDPRKWALLLERRKELLAQK